MSETQDKIFYRAGLGRGAAARGEHIICEVLGWAGVDDRLAHVRVVRSTRSAIRSGQLGLVPRERLRPLPAPDGCLR